MRRIGLLILLILSTVLLMGCGLRERLLAPPDEWEAPEGTLIATCTVDDDVHKYIYKDDGIYQYYINDMFQGDAVIEEIQEQAYLNGESMANYLNMTYDSGECIVDDYYDSE